MAEACRQGAALPPSTPRLMILASSSGPSCRTLHSACSGLRPRQGVSPLRDFAVGSLSPCCL